MVWDFAISDVYYHVRQREGKMKCCESGIDVFEPGYDCIIDEGEAVSWEWINQQIYKQDLQDEYQEVDSEIVRIFEDLVESAKEYHEITGRYLQIWGELGELYAEIKYGLKRHKPHASGSDGRMANDFVEIKTISPEKVGATIQVKKRGNFNKLLIVKISDDFSFESTMIDRHDLPKQQNKTARISWQNAIDSKAEPWIKSV